MGKFFRNNKLYFFLIYFLDINILGFQPTEALCSGSFLQWIKIIRQQKLYINSSTNTDIVFENKLPIIWQTSWSEPISIAFLQPPTWWQLHALQQSSLSQNWDVINAQQWQKDVHTTEHRRINHSRTYQARKCTL